MPHRFQMIGTRVVRATPAAFLAVAALTGSLASADSGARAQDIAARDAVVDQVLLLNAVRGADVAQEAVAMNALDPCSAAAPTGVSSAPDPERTALIYPAQGSPELNFLGGAEAGKGTYAYQVSYEQPIGEKSLSVGLTYLNEGHIDNDHRDDYAAQLWGKWNLFDGRLRVGAGIGPDVYYGTVVADDPNGYKDSHGDGLVGVMGSLMAEVPLGHGFSLQARLNRLRFSNSYDATTGLLGISYQLPESEYDRASSADYADGVSDESKKYTVAVGMGRSIINNFHSETGTADEVSVGRDLKGPLEATVSFLNEGDAKIFSRMGIATQIGLRQSFDNGFVTLHADVGPYFNHVSKLLPGAGDGDKPSPVVALFTYGARFRITSHTGIGISLNRVTTKNSTDSDVLMIQEDWNY